MNVKIISKYYIYIDELWHSSKDSNSIKNGDMGGKGRWYTTKKLSKKSNLIFMIPMHSNVEKTGVDPMVWWTYFL